MEKKRSYNSELRQAQAEETKHRILSSANDLFETKGIEKVTIEELAQRADVSAPTVYALFQSKRGILRALIDRALFGAQHALLVQKVRSAKSAKERVMIAASIARQVHDAERSQMWLLRGATVLSPELEELERDLEQQRFERQEETIKLLVKENALANGLSMAKARDVLWTMTGWDTYRMLVMERGWPSDEYEKWLSGVLAQILSN